MEKLNGLALLTVTLKNEYSPKLPSNRKTSRNINSEATLKAFKTGRKYLWTETMRPNVFLLR
jgi:hypothetical protein